jgi:2-keto-4-pentenoate hydratase/2-oxohepta-3-ene-1,7-dioic acid hydratase in catechol pathway
MKVANLAGRLTIVTDDGAIDVAKASSGLFAPDPQAIYGRWGEFLEWVGSRTIPTEQARPYSRLDLQAPAPSPRQLFAMGFNYRAHATEFGTAVGDELPPVFTKFPSSIAGPYDTVRLPEGSVDWEVELVVVIGRRAWQVPETQAWQHVAGVTVGQDLSERVTQMRGKTPQFSLGKSFPGFAPMGPWLVTPDDLDNPDDLHLRCTLNGETVQNGSTSHMIAPVPTLIAKLSAVVPLLPGDVLYTGTPSGVGMGRVPQRFLSPGDELVSHIEGIGHMRHTMSPG